MDSKNQPLAHRMRPQTIGEFVGQEHLISEGKPLSIAIKTGDLPTSIIFWGPPGCGKTTLARLIAKVTNSEFVGISAVNAKKEDIMKTVQRAKLFQKKVILFLDEIHRFNKAQQDSLLPHVENGTITLIGATTENPSFEVISALLSRSRVFVLEQLTQEQIKTIIERAINDKERGLGNKNLKIGEEHLDLISKLANGDARSAFNILELVASLNQEITIQKILEAVQKSHLRYDKDGEEHYNIISALHKSMRDSDPQAAVYWTMRMVEAGEDPKYIIRRMIRFASEDIGNADPNALSVAVAAKQAVEFLGYPECDTALVQTAIYLATAPKSNAVYEAVLKSKKHINETGNLPVPLVIRNAPTKLMKDLNYGKGYQYAHHHEDAKVNQQHLPKEIEEKVKQDPYYQPTDRGHEKIIKENMKKNTLR